MNPPRLRPRRIAAPSGQRRVASRRCVMALGAAALLVLGAVTIRPASAQYPPGGYRPANAYPTPAAGGFTYPAGRPAPASAPAARIAAGGIPSAYPMPSATGTAATAEQPTVAPESQGPTWGDTLRSGYARVAAGGWLMIPLGVCLAVTLLLAAERTFSLRRGRVIPKPFVRRFTECIDDGQLSFDEATGLCDEFDCPVAEVFRAAVRRWGRPMMEIEQAVLDAGDRVSTRLRRFIRVFHAVANVAPLFGLLGTVLGMIESFAAISGDSTMGQPELLAGGISQALVTTAAGLMTAIPAYLAFTYFSGKTEGYLSEIDRLCSKVIDGISAETLEQSKASRRKRAA